jgi:hypothetical protein
MFYDELSPYGRWIDYPEYGYVWKPNVDQGFRPYATNGHWVYSDAGWTWVSDFSWGWAAFHYGRWFHDDNYGWMWLPGHQWAPAWVTWGQSGNYYGWAPVPPKVDVNSGWKPKNEDWNFVPAQHINKVDVNNYVVKNDVTVINKTTIINNVTNNNVTNNVTKNVTNNNVTNNNITNNRNTNTVIYNAGPKVNEIENITNVKIQQVKINEGNKPGQTVVNNNNIVIFRPVIKENKPQENKPAPQKVENYKPNSNQNPTH